MSFKREGDDKSQLNILKKRRVADLLSNFIPEDEAALMKNGRYACLVCSYRPVFDTVDMLTVHRQGKKHLEGLRAFYGKKAKLKNEISKRQHERYIQSEEGQQEPSSSAPLLAQTRKLTQHALLKTVPYNSCHRKNSTKPGRRQTSTDLDPIGNPSRKMPTASCKSEVSEAISATTSAVSNEESALSVKKGDQAAGTVVAEPLTAQRRMELNHYLKLKSDGWVQDRNGHWVKDENVEFDSDEEEPAPLPAAD
ncbi:PREDICTED: sodium channel modifier 1 isoform X1 [Cyprinodon variegatus]|uniref:Sodium channel modifier 1 n=1 Tax=Cyprinodon variegatus TaxID=28743 RepID=A0A3Q2G259_CYPVA|nr:PREDICTED: sodium channel modifier 1 isoform X1 [Cyprinodon variegatus]